MPPGSKKKTTGKKGKSKKRCDSKYDNGRDLGVLGKLSLET